MYERVHRYFIYHNNLEELWKKPSPLGPNRNKQTLS